MLEKNPLEKTENACPASPFITLLVTEPVGNITGENALLFSPLIIFTASRKANKSPSVIPCCPHVMLFAMVYNQMSDSR